MGECWILLLSSCWFPVLIDATRSGMNELRAEQERIIKEQNALIVQQQAAINRLTEANKQLTDQLRDLTCATPYGKYAASSQAQGQQQIPKSVSQKLHVAIVSGSNDKVAREFVTWLRKRLAPQYVLCDLTDNQPADVAIPVFYLQSDRVPSSDDVTAQLQMLLARYEAVSLIPVFLALQNNVPRPHHHSKFPPQALKHEGGCIRVSLPEFNNGTPSESDPAVAFVEAQLRHSQAELMKSMISEPKWEAHSPSFFSRLFGGLLS